MTNITNRPWQYGGFDYTTGQTLLDYGRGLGANFVGQPFSVYRLNNTTSGDVVQTPTRIFQNFPVRRKDGKGAFIESPRSSLVYWYKLMMDASPLLVGDIFVETDAAYGPGADSVTFATDQFVGFALATHPVLNKIVGARLDRFVTIFRAPTLQQGGFFTQTLDTALPLVCTNGVFAFGANGAQASSIPCGFQLDRRMRAPGYSDAPEQTPNPVWSIYVPPINGYTPQNGDELVASDGARYRVLQPYYQNVGASGIQLICERHVGSSPA